MGFSNALLYSGLGLLVVFFALLLLMFIINILAKAMPAEAAQSEALSVSDAEKAKPVPAPGNAGEIALNGVDPRTAAMCMAIVAAETGKPVNELRFKSIKEYSNEV